MKAIFSPHTSISVYHAVTFTAPGPKPQHFLSPHCSPWLPGQSSGKKTWHVAWQDQTGCASETSCRPEDQRAPS